MDDAFGPGSCASHEAPSGLRHSAAIPIAALPTATFHHGTNCYGCPHCACGCVPDWLGEAPLRCTGCKAALRPHEISVEEAKAVCERAGILCHEPETDDEKLDRLWGDFVRFASSIEHLTSKGARLPPRDYLGYSVALVIRATHAVADTAQ